MLLKFIGHPARRPHQAWRQVLWNISVRSTDDPSLLKTLEMVPNGQGELMRQTVHVNQFLDF